MADLRALRQTTKRDILPRHEYARGIGERIGPFIDAGGFGRRVKRPTPSDQLPAGVLFSSQARGIEAAHGGPRA